nr:leucine-rich repeat extensin-like protein 3 [Arachis hypogaea]
MTQNPTSSRPPFPFFFPNPLYSLPLPCAPSPPSQPPPLATPPSTTQPQPRRHHPLLPSLSFFSFSSRPPSTTAAPLRDHHHRAVTAAPTSTITLTPSFSPLLNPPTTITPTRNPLPPNSHQPPRRPPCSAAAPPCLSQHYRNHTPAIFQFLSLVHTPTRFRRTPPFFHS